MAKYTERPVTSVDDIGGFFSMGTVVGARTWTETHYSSTTTSSGGGGHLIQGSGYVSAPSSSTTVSSHVAEMLGFFLDFGNNQENEFKLDGEKFSARDGHSVSVIRVGPKDEGWGYAVAYYNHSMSRGYAREAWLERPLDKKPTKLWLWLAPILSLLVGGLLSGIAGGLGLILMPIALGIAIYFYSQKKGEYRRLIDAVRICRDEQIQAAKTDHAERQAKADSSLIEINDQTERELGS